jgi:hypothetical protein
MRGETQAELDVDTIAPRHCHSRAFPATVVSQPTYSPLVGCYRRGMARRIHG